MHVYVCVCVPRYYLHDEFQMSQWVVGRVVDYGSGSFSSQLTHSHFATRRPLIWFIKCDFHCTCIGQNRRFIYVCWCSIWIGPLDYRKSSNKHPLSTTSSTTVVLIWGWLLIGVFTALSITVTEWYQEEGRGIRDRMGWLMRTFRYSGLFCLTDWLFPRSKCNLCWQSH